MGQVAGACTAMVVDIDAHTGWVGRLECNVQKSRWSVGGPVTWRGVCGVYTYIVQCSQ